MYCATLPLPETRQVLPFERLAAGAEHLGREVDRAVAGRLGTNEAAAPVQTLAGQHARELVPDPLVLAEHETDLAAADADVARRHVGVRADVTEELGHEALTELHDFVVALALRVEVGTALAAAHRERRQAVLEHLLEGQELQDAEVDARVEPEAALVGADGAVHLDAETAVDLDVALVIEPRHAEHDDALGLHDPLEDVGLAVLGALLDDRPDRLDDLIDGLDELGLRRILRVDVSHEVLEACCCHHILLR